MIGPVLERYSGIVLFHMQNGHFILTGWGVLVIFFTALLASR